VSDSKTVLALAPSRLHPAALAVFGDEFECLDGGAPDAVTPPEVIARAHAIVGAVTPAVLQIAEHLEVIGIPGSGSDHIDVAGATERGILVVNAAGGQATAVAEHAVGLMLAWAKRIAVSDRIFHTEGTFRGRDHFSGEPWPGMPHEIGGKTVGIVGFGAIGRDLARKCVHAFDMRVLVHDPFVGPGDVVAAGAEPVDDLAELLEQSDFVSLHLPLTEATRGLIGAQEFGRMRPTACLVNLARGGVVDEDALVAALRSGRIAGAALDVFEEEPGPDHHPLYGMSNVVCSGHIGGWVAEAVPRLAAIMAEEMRTALRGERPTRLVDPRAWTVARARSSASGGPTA